MLKIRCSERTGVVIVKSWERAVASTKRQHRGNKILKTFKWVDFRMSANRRKDQEVFEEIKNSLNFQLFLPKTS